jgi:PAS domain S-box-containing protein
LLSHAPAAVAVLRGPEYRFEWVNADYEKLLGRTAAESIGKTVREVIPEVEGQIYVELLDKVYRTGEAFTGHESLFRIDRGDGALRDAYVNFVYIPTRDAGGAIDGIFVHATDVTDLVIARKLVEESEKRYRFLSEFIPQMVWTAAPDGGLDFVSARVGAYFGGSREEFLGAGWLRGVHPDDQRTAVDRWRHSLLTGQPYETSFRLLRGSDRTWRWHLARALPLFGDDGAIVQWFGTCTDIEDQKATEAELTRANRELEEFAYVASHDLQEPLRMVNIYTELILNDLGEEGARLGPYAGYVQQGVGRMQALIHDLLAFSRAVHSDERIGRADLTSALHEAMSLLKNRIEESGCILATEPLPMVCADPSQVAHVFQNLLSNAIKYRRHGVAPSLQIGAQRDGNQWIVSVRDNGIGFEPQYADRIFGLFKRLHTDAYPGTGLGLAICKRIVERNGGRIWADGRPGEGATFYFSLPAVE